jgi:DNA modification methylase
MHQVIQGDCLKEMAKLPDNSIDAVVTDPPYGLSQHSQPDITEALTAWISGQPYTKKGGGFMGATWDSFVPGPEVWREVFRVLKPGGHALVFASSRTQDLMAIALRLSGFELRDTILWVYGSGFPKSHDISKAIDREAGAEREVVGIGKGAGSSRAQSLGVFSPQYNSTAPATPAAKQWEGWGTALKPGYEPVILVRKPVCGTVAQNVIEWGTGGINIDECRVESHIERPLISNNVSASNLTGVGGASTYGSYAVRGSKAVGTTTQGRFPANFIHDGSEQVLECFPETKSGGSGNDKVKASGPVYSDWSTRKGGQQLPNSGSAARFFKACTDDDPEDKNTRRIFYSPKASKRDRDEGVNRNTHPTVKNTSLMRYLCRLITPPGGIILDPFAGSGSTGKAAALEGFNFIGMELSEEYAEIARARVKWALDQVSPQPSLEDRLSWLETQVQAQGHKLKKLEQSSQQLSLFNLGG